MPTYGTNAPYEPSFIPKLINAKKMAAKRYVLICGLFHLCLVSTRWLAIGPGSCELPQIGVCNAIGSSLEEGEAVNSITAVRVAMSAVGKHTAVHF